MDKEMVARELVAVARELSGDQWRRGPIRDTDYYYILSDKLEKSAAHLEEIAKYYELFVKRQKLERDVVDEVAAAIRRLRDAKASMEDVANSAANMGDMLTGQAS